MKAEYRVTDIIVAKKRRFKDTSAIIEGFSDKYGYMHLLAKGIFRKQSAIQGMEPLSANTVTYFYKPGRELNTVTECRMDFYPEHIPNDYQSYLYVNRMFRILRNHKYENETNNRVYAGLYEAMKAMNEKENPETEYAHFLLEYMNIEGIYRHNDMDMLKRSIEGRKISRFIEEAENRIKGGF